MRLALVVLAIVMCLAIPATPMLAQDTTITDTVGIGTPSDQQNPFAAFGVNWEYTLAASLFIFLHVNAVKGFLPGISSRGTTLLVLAFSAVYHAVSYTHLTLPTTPYV